MKPTARETLLDAARAAIGVRSWASLRMVEVAAEAGVSRQTLYNEFGSKRGLGAALVTRETDDFLDGVERVLAGALAADGADVPEALVTAADWTLRTVSRNPLVRAALTGYWDESLPGPVHEPAGVLRALRDRAARVLERAGVDRRGGEAACEAVARLTLSYVIVPGTDSESVRSELRTVGRAAGRTVVAQCTRQPLVPGAAVGD